MKLKPQWKRGKKWMKSGWENVMNRNDYEKAKRMRDYSVKFYGKRCMKRYEILLIFLLKELSISNVEMVDQISKFSLKSLISWWASPAFYHLSNHSIHMQLSTPKSTSKWIKFYSFFIIMFLEKVQLMWILCYSFSTKKSVD
jgi:hypothetical protein